MNSNEESLGACCKRLLEELRQPYDQKYMFERDGMLALTAGYNHATETEREHWVRAFHAGICSSKKLMRRMPLMCLNALLG